MKVALELKNDYGWHRKGTAIKGVRYALPYFKSNQGAYLHRLRSANQYWSEGKLTHTSVKFWCGNIGYTNKGRLFATIPEGEVLCATCEGRAIGAGIYEKPFINGRLVKYQPQI